MTQQRSNTHHRNNTTQHSNAKRIDGHQGHYFNALLVELQEPTLVCEFGCLAMDLNSAASMATNGYQLSWCTRGRSSSRYLFDEQCTCNKSLYFSQGRRQTHNVYKDEVMVRW